MAKKCETITYSVCPPTGECKACKEIIQAQCIKYYGSDLECIEVTSGDKLDEILLKIDSKVCNIGEGSESNVPSDDVVSVSIKIITGEDFTDVGGGIWEYALQQEDSGKLIIMYVDADVYPDEYRVTIPDDLCIGLPNEIMKVGFFIVDGNCWWQNGSGGGFVKQLSLADAVSVVNTGSGGESAFVIFTATEGATLASVEVTLVNKQGTYYTPDYWQFRNDVNLMPIVEDGSYHLKEGVNIIYADSDIDGITIYVDAGINFKYEDIQLYVAGYKVTNVVWRDNDDLNNDITASRNLPSTLQAGDFVKIKNMEDNDFIVLENYKKSIPLSGTETNRPVIGDIEFQTDILGETLNRIWREFGDNTEEFVFKDNSSIGIRHSKGTGEYNEISVDANGITFHSNDSTVSDVINVIISPYRNGTMIVSCDNPLSAGITGDGRDYSANITALDYPQKLYVDGVSADLDTDNPAIYDSGTGFLTLPPNVSKVNLISTYSGVLQINKIITTTPNTPLRFTKTAPSTTFQFMTGVENLLNKNFGNPFLYIDDTDYIKYEWFDNAGVFQAVDYWTYD